ncbi:hypothetical protein C8J57DRAFT_1536860 [Mycena rebaudengoi]|nr:hypothetical protein C8J57DRAFT_1536860 [Mycena rebaudengoi]
MQLLPQEGVEATLSPTFEDYMPCTPVFWYTDPQHADIAAHSDSSQGRFYVVGRGFGTGIFLDSLQADHQVAGYRDPHRVACRTTEAALQAWKRDVCWPLHKGNFPPTKHPRHFPPSVPAQPLLMGPAPILPSTAAPPAKASVPTPPAAPIAVAAPSTPPPCPVVRFWNARCLIAVACVPDAVDACTSCTTPQTHIQLTSRHGEASTSTAGSASAAPSSTSAPPPKTNAVSAPPSRSGAAPAANANASTTPTAVPNANTAPAPPSTPLPLAAAAPMPSPAPMQWAVSGVRCFFSSREATNAYVKSNHLKNIDIVWSHDQEELETFVCLTVP